jgi:hypothetical protein
MVVYGFWVHRFHTWSRSSVGMASRKVPSTKFEVPMFGGGGGGRYSDDDGAGKGRW